MLYMCLGFSYSTQSSIRYGSGPRHMGQQDYHQRPQELPQVRVFRLTSLLLMEVQDVSENCPEIMCTFLCLRELKITNSISERGDNKMSFLCPSTRCLSEPLMTYKLHSDFLMAVSKL